MKHKLEYSIWSAKISWCDICKKHFYNQENDEHILVDKQPDNKSLSDVEARVIQPNSFINGDCMEFMRTCPPNFFDLAIVDPPYEIGIAKWDVKPEEAYSLNKNL